MERGVKGRHAVEAVVVSCMDFRLYSGDLSANLFRTIRETFSVGDFDILTIAGGARNVDQPSSPERRTVLFEDIQMALEKHRASKIIFLTHENCGKYASEGIIFKDCEEEKRFHAKELAEVLKPARERFPNATVKAGYVIFKNENSISIEEVK